MPRRKCTLLFQQNVDTNESVSGKSRVSWTLRETSFMGFVKRSCKDPQCRDASYVHV